MSDLDTPAVTGPLDEDPSARAASGSFCVRLWQHMRLIAGGEARVCCAFQGKAVAHDGVPVSTDRQSLMEIWNADTMRELRRDMVAGRPIAGCEWCYSVEKHGGVSIRIKDNIAWEQDWYNDQRSTIDAMMAQAVENDYRLPKLPAMIEVEVGNLCNLKCRMCNSFSSSRIAKDQVHRNWDGFEYSFNGEPGNDEPGIERGHGRIRRVGPIEGLFDELPKDTGSQVRVLYFLGGEPFLVREIPLLLERLVATGRAPQIGLLFVSNGSIVPQWLSLAAQFRRLDLGISVDGYADHYEYIRYPGRWSKLAHNLQLFKQIPNLSLQVTTTVQVNNALSLTNLFRYLDSVEIGFTAYMLENPHHLAVSALPAPIRRLGAARLTEYADSDCRPEHRALVLSLAAQFEAGEEAGDPRLLRDLMLFTNDMDTTRGQSIHQTDPELVGLLERAGFPWIDETLHASTDSTERQLPRRVRAPMAAQNEALKLHHDLAVAVKTLRNELAESRAELTQTRDDMERTRTELGQTQPELKQTNDALTRTHGELQQVRDELARTRDELAQTRNGLRMHEEHAAHAGRQLAQVYASRSWRATRPLRAAGRLLRGSSPAGRSPGKSDAR
jgi:MoaA/NifB/PqqE/SkfB family radical SAM enzyme